MSTFCGFLLILMSTFCGFLLFSMSTLLVCYSISLAIQVQAWVE